MDLQATKKRVEELLRARNHTETLPLITLQHGCQPPKTEQNIHRARANGPVHNERGETASTTNPVSAVPNNNSAKTNNNACSTLSTNRCEHKPSKTRIKNTIRGSRATTLRGSRQPHSGKPGNPSLTEGTIPTQPSTPEETIPVTATLSDKTETPIKKELVIKPPVVPRVSFDQPNPYNISNYHAKELFKLNQLKKNYIQNKIDYYYLKPVILLGELKREHYEEEKIDCITENNKTATLKIKNLNYMKSQPQYRISKQDLLAYVKANNEIPKKQVGEAFLMQIFGKKPLQDLRPSQETHRYKIVSIDHHDFMHLKANYL